VSVDRLSVVLAAMASVDGDAPTVIDRVCMAAVALLSLSGAGISLMVEGELRGSAGVSEPGIAMVQELQLELGEGPCVDSWNLNQAVLEPDLAEPARVRWPSFSHAGVEAGLRAVFAYPLHIGAIRIGVLVLYRDHPGALDGEELARALVLADVASQIVLAVQAGASSDNVHELLAGEPPHWAEVHQATGMVSAQLEVSIDEAFVRLRARAFADRRALRDVARDVATRQLRFDPDTDG
jgi:GAF domain-containing protein